ncbi:MAG: ribosome-associated protein [Humisphaera sp.]|nr:ribosome-associated protein [Humisphaera sp.]
MDIELAPGVSAPADAVRFQFARSGGPGGQNVNKLNTKAELWVRLDAISGLTYGAIARLRHAGGRRITSAGEIHLTSESERGQEGNRAAVMQRLREMIVLAKVEPKVRRKSKPSRGQKAKRLEQKKHRGAIKSLRRRSSREE